MTSRDEPHRLIPAAGVVLAGGGSRRMGRDKPSLPWKGTSLGLYMVSLFSEWFEETVIAANDAGVFHGRPYRIVKDVFTGGGTLAGLHGALSGSGREWNFVAGVDMPFIAEPLVRLLWDLREGHDVVVPTWGGHLEVTCAFYSRACIGPAAESLGKGILQVFSFFDRIRVRTVPEEVWRTADPAGASFRNLNTPEDYERALREIGE